MTGEDLQNIKAALTRIEKASSEYHKMLETVKLVVDDPFEDPRSHPRLKSVKRELDYAQRSLGRRWKLVRELINEFDGRGE